MGENYAICLIEAMDRLWFQEIVLFSEPTTLIPPQAINRSVPVPVSESLTYQSSIMSIPEDEEILSPPSSITSQQVYNNNSLSETHSSFKDDSDSEKGSKQRRRSTGFNGITSGFGSHSSLTMAQNRAANLRYSCSLTRLQKSTSCKSLSELEVEEVKGFMDLGFKFGQSQLSPRMMSVLPGLQRLGCHMNEEEDGGVKGDEVEKNDEIEKEREEEEKRLSVMRPYLSEAWLIKRPDSPLLNLRVPRVYAAADMKKHLKYWARTVASVIHQES